MEWGAPPTPPPSHSWRYSSRQTSVVINFIVFAFNVHRTRYCTRKSNYTFRLAPTDPKIGLMAVQISEIISKSRRTHSSYDLYRFLGPTASWHSSSSCSSPYVSGTRSFARIAMMIVSYQSSQFTMLLPTSIFVMYMNTHTHDMESTPYFSTLGFYHGRWQSECRHRCQVEEDDGTGMMMMSFCRNNSINTANLIVCHSAQ